MSSRVPKKRATPATLLSELSPRSESNSCHSGLIYHRGQWEKGKLCQGRAWERNSSFQLIQRKECVAVLFVGQGLVSVTDLVAETPCCSLPECPWPKKGPTSKQLKSSKPPNIRLFFGKEKAEMGGSNLQAVQPALMFFCLFFAKKGARHGDMGSGGRVGFVSSIFGPNRRLSASLDGQALAVLKPEADADFSAARTQKSHAAWAFTAPKTPGFEGAPLFALIAGAPYFGRTPHSELVRETWRPKQTFELCSITI